MLGKKYSLGSTFEATGESLVKIANFDELQNQGDDIKAFLASFKPDPNFVYMHVIAVGSGEYWGKNINSDYFPEQDLINRHKTFETQAKVFKEHNNKPDSPSYGHVAFSWYNPKMHRVELIMAIDKVKGKDFINRQANGEQLCVSMGCKVRFDVCSICGNKASKPNEYCEHIKLHKGEIFPDGKQAYMINYNPTFFDISIVAHPAWKPAFVLSKVASDNTSQDTLNKIASGAEQFENLDLTADPIPSVTWEIPENDELLGEKNYEHAVKVASAGMDIDRILFENTPVEKKATMVKHSPAEAVRVINQEVFDLLPAIEKIEKDLPEPLLDNLARNYEIKDILKSFIGSAIPLKPHEFARIVIVKNKLPDEYFEAVLEGIYRSIFEEDKPAAGFATGTVRPKILDMLVPFLKNRCSVVDSVLPRLHTIIDKDSFDNIVKTAAEIYTPNPVMDALELNPQMNFGFVRRRPAYQESPVGLSDDVVMVNPSPKFSTLPMALSKNMALKELQSPSLSNFKRDQALALGALAGKDYSAFKNPDIIRSVLKEPSIASSIALLLSSFTSENKAKNTMYENPLYNRLVLEHLLNAHNPNKKSFMQNILSI